VTSRRQIPGHTSPNSSQDVYVDDLGRKGGGNKKSSGDGVVQISFTAPLRKEDTILVSMRRGWKSSAGEKGWLSKYSHRLKEMEYSRYSI
jgi:hypothetical protein